MNTGAEAVETAIKVVRRWGYTVKGVPADQASIVVCAGNFHGRTTTIAGFSSDPETRSGFGPFTPGFTSVPFGDAERTRRRDAATPRSRCSSSRSKAKRAWSSLRTATSATSAGSAPSAASCSSPTRSNLGSDAPVAPSRAITKGSAPTSSWWARRWAVGSCRSRRWSGLGTYSACCRAGTHGSTFGGNPLACAIGREVIAMLRTGEYQDRSARLGAHLHARVRELLGRGVTAVRGRGLWAGLDLDERMPALASSRRAGAPPTSCSRTSPMGATLRLAPPLVICDSDLDWGLDQIGRRHRAAVVRTAEHEEKGTR